MVDPREDMVNCPWCSQKLGEVEKLSCTRSKQDAVVAAARAVVEVVIPHKPEGDEAFLALSRALTYLDQTEQKVE